VDWSHLAHCSPASVDLRGSYGDHRFLPCEHQYQRTPWSESASELHRPSDRHLSAKLVPTFADRGSHVVSVTDPYGSILSFMDRSCFFSIK
jgi:hypothetical protein